jgi:hypothetical protein
MVMLAAVQLLAVVCAGLFAGAAVYITFVEHPARMECGTRLAATVWAPSYRRATWMQAPLAIVGALAGVAVWALGGGIGWLGGGVLIGLVVPFTLVVVMPTNHRLEEPGRDLGSAETRALLVRWGRLHAVRSVLGVVATAIFAVLVVAR